MSCDATFPIYEGPPPPGSTTTGASYSFIGDGRYTGLTTVALTGAGGVFDVTPVWSQCSAFLGGTYFLFTIETPTFPCRSNVDEYWSYASGTRVDGSALYGLLYPITGNGATPYAVADQTLPANGFAGSVAAHPGGTDIAYQDGWNSGGGAQPSSEMQTVTLTVVQKWWDGAAYQYDLWHPSTLYLAFSCFGTGGGGGTSPFVASKHLMIDAPSTETGPGGNVVAWGMSNQRTIVSSLARVAQVGLYRPVTKDIAARGSPSVFLDTSVVETNESVSSYGGKDVLPGGCNPIWLPSGALVAIYRTRSTVGGTWSYWWRVNYHSGVQDTQPTISSGTMGNWSTRQALTIPTSVWCQITRGQGRIIALYNDGAVTYTPTGNTYTRTAGTLYVMYALDPLCQTWSTPVAIATGVMPLTGGLCWTGEAWVACYTRNSDLVPLCLRSGKLLDWSGLAPVATGVQTSTSQNLHCFGLAYARGQINGVFAPYADSPGSGTFGYYLSVFSGNLGTTWKIARPTDRQGMSVSLDGGATVCEEIALLNAPGASPAMCYSDTGFRLDSGNHFIP